MAPNILSLREDVIGAKHTTCRSNTTDWRNQYNMNHKTVPELTRSILLDLKNIKKVFATKDGKKARSIKAKVGTAPKKVAFQCAQETWKGRRFWRTSPQEGTLRQVLQVVQGGGWGLSDSRYYQVLQV